MKFVVPRSFSQHAPTIFVSACSVLLDVVIIGFTIRARTALPLISPWDVLPSWIFLAFGVATIFQLIAVRVLPRWVSCICLMFHGFTAWSTAAIIYRLGFGFDPFLHQAAEQHLATHHSISLTTPLYLGQYLLVWALHTLSRIPIIQMDQWLVPILSLGLIPLLQRTNRFLPIVFFLLPVSWLSVTIPFHLGLLLFICALCVSKTPDSRRTQLALIACGLGSLLIHPLIGLPCCIFVTSTLLERTKWRRFSSPLLFIGPALILLGSFGGYVALQHATLSLPTTEQVATSFIALFGTAYRFTFEAPLLSLLYGFLSLWPFAICILGLWANLREPTVWNTQRRLMAFGLCISAILLACFIRLPDIIAHEQFEFPLRLLQLIPVLFLPDVAQHIEQWLETAGRRKHLAQISIILAIGSISATQWFVSYPQNNAVVHAYAPSISQYEFEAVDWIERERQGRPFITLSHQMLAAAALQKHGFEQTITTCHGTHLAYAIPTGGALYQDFLALLRSAEKEIILQRLQRCYGDTDRFVSIPTYWDPTQRIDQALSPMTEKRSVFGSYLTVYKLK